MNLQKWCSVKLAGVQPMNGNLTFWAHLKMLSPFPGLAYLTPVSVRPSVSLGDGDETAIPAGLKIGTTRKFI
jgi:hypothetical protein